MKRGRWAWILALTLLTLCPIAGCLLAYTTIGAK